MNAKNFAISSLMVSAAFAGGCNFVPKKAVLANADFLTPTQLRDFPAENIRTVNNKIFLWKSDISSETVKRVTVLAREIDVLDDEAFPINAKLVEVGKKFDEIDAELKPVKQRVGQINRRLPKARKELDAAVAAQDQAAVDRLTAEISALETELAEKKAKQAELDEKIAPIAEEKARLELAVAESSEKGRVKVDEITQLVEWYKGQPSGVSFAFTNGPDGYPDASLPIRSEIRGWNFSDDQGDRNFSTQLGTIRDVKYAVRGGVYTFKVIVLHDPAGSLEGVADADVQGSLVRETFCFRMGRAKYERMGTSDTRIFFAADVLHVDGWTETCDADLLKRRYKESGRTFPLRQGIGKFVDRNN